jgi:flagellum-specific peptidoglycan hydrolase FlgJ
MERFAFLNKVRDAAMATAKKYHISFAALVAQAALESNWDKDPLVALANNYFGVKVFDPKKPHVTILADGNPGAMFYKFNSMQESFDGQGALLTNSRYKPALKYRADLRRYGDMLQTLQYCAPPKAGDMTYGEKIENIARNLGIYLTWTEEVDKALQELTDDGVLTGDIKDTSYRKSALTVERMAVILRRFKETL